jgi:hypothetical protein
VVGLSPSAGLADSFDSFQKTDARLKHSRLSSGNSAGQLLFFGLREAQTWCPDLKRSDFALSLTIFPAGSKLGSRFRAFSLVPLIPLAALGIINGAIV